MSSYSYSMLSTAQTCQKKYWHIFENKTPVLGAPSGDMAFGSALHASLQALLEKQTLEEATLLFNTYWGVIKNKPHQYGRHKWESLSEMGPLFLRRFASTHLKDITPILVEQRLYGNGYEGTPDVVGLYKGIPCIIDFKTSGTNYQPEQAMTGEQMMLYARLTELETVVRPKAVVYIVFNKGTGSIQRPIVQEITPALLSSHMENLDKQVYQLSNLKTYGDYVKNTGNCFKYSRKCEFFNHCHPHAIGYPAAEEAGE